ncbi:MAG TPA: flagellar basal body-associated FliL family protein [Rhodocyclaceae bacterium]|jgi:flagellar FliL protein
MAEAKTEEAPKKKGKLLLFIIIGVVVVAIAAVAAILLLKKHPAEEGEDGEAAPVAKVEKKKASDHPAAPPAYVKLDTFTSNLASDGADPQGAQYIQVVVELKVESAHEGDALKPYTPEIRNAILRLLSSRKAAQLTSVDGKDALAEDIRGAVNSIINPPRKNGPVPEEPVQAVLFSSFIIQ